MDIRKISIKKIVPLLASFAVIFFMSFPSVVFSAGLVPCNGPDCDWSALVTMGNRIINFLLGASVSIATLLFMYAGFLYIFKSSGSGKEEAKKVFWNVVVGFLWVAGGFLVIKFILVGLGIEPSKYLNG